MKNGIHVMQYVDIDRTFMICLCDILAYILLFLSFIFYYGFISMENMLLFYLYKAHIMNDHTLNVFLTVCYRRAVAVSSCRPACLHVSFCLCLQVCLCHRLSIFCLASVLSAVYLSVCSNLSRWHSLVLVTRSTHFLLFSLLVYCFVSCSYGKCA